ncbi:aspartate aminotransferase family protein [Kribbella sp. CA-245084]|uniref:aspartate aminotransferase family protein n=1 Tax=Kribbella sp. CA-245084 TaxID=3239940 RepID=UPI003D917C2B
MSREGTATESLLAREDAAIGDCLKIRFYPLVVERAEGVTLTDADGNEYLDFIAAGGVVQTGYRHPRVREAIVGELDTSWSTMHCCYPGRRAVELAERLCSLLPGDFRKKAWFGTTGSDANDCLAKLLPVATGRPRLISFTGAYHGQTLGSASLSGHSAQARVLGTGNVTKIPYPDPYRPMDASSSASASEQVLTYLSERVLTSISPAADTAAIVLEPIQSDGGDIVPPDDFLPGLRQLCDRHGIWLVFDEVKTGLGRTGAMFGFQHSGVVPDAVSLGKPLGGGLPLSAVVGRAELFDHDVPNLFTLGGSPAPAAGGLAVLDVLADENLIVNAKVRGEQLLEGLRELQSRHRLIGDVRGRGLLLGAELVADRKTREPAATDAARLVYRCFELGLIVMYTGLHSNVIELTPPLILTEEDALRGLDILDRGLTDIESGTFDDTKLAGYAGW